MQTHGTDQAIQDQILRERLTIHVNALHNQIPKLLAQDRSILENITQEEKLSGPTSTITTWLQMVEPTIQKYLQDAQHKLQSHQPRFMRLPLKKLPTKIPTSAIRPTIPWLHLRNDILHIGPNHPTRLTAHPTFLSAHPTRL